LASCCDYHNFKKRQKINELKLIVNTTETSYLIEDGYILTLKDPGFVSKSCTINNVLK